MPVECVGRAGDVVYWPPRLVHSPGINRSGTTADPTIRQAVICEWQRSGPGRTLISHPTSNPGPKFQFWIDTRHWEEDTDAPTPENIWDGWAFNCEEPLGAERRG